MPALPRATDDAGPAAWWSLWHEPWLEAHPGWWRGSDGLSHTLLARFQHPGPGCRLAYRTFCQYFGIDTGLASPRPFPLAAVNDLPALPLSRQELVAAATALGRVGYASHCLTSSRHGLARLFSQGHQDAGDADAWRDALRQARARPLAMTTGHEPPPDASAAQLQRWALPLMARLIEDAVPGAWARLRLRFDPQCFALEPLAPAPYPVALQRQAWRIWRAAALNDLSDYSHEIPPSAS
ncbi:hypothetical protein SAMN05216359_10242 [Roseateles sp. YR242]|uniref:hypothetical protein n=1 Tax=Roseateles sp. YR242 TaxID=1855305 RepID=UPI0008B51E6C|nr:hypothetical protein [Roseateles sp. YR242]SEK51368.1 hypothetical protein SAMN05216359_10242 [Roseateles sp. YR242]